MREIEHNAAEIKDKRSFFSQLMENMRRRADEGDEVIWHLCLLTGICGS